MADLVQLQVGAHSHWVSHLQPLAQRAQVKFCSTSLSPAEDILRSSPQ